MYTKTFKGIIATLAVALAGSVVYFLYPSFHESRQPPSSGPKSDTAFETLPETLTYKNLKAETVSLSDYRDKKIRIINTWATWCQFCLEELPHFIELQKSNPDTVSVIAINRGESAEKQREYMVTVGIGENDLVFLTDITDTFYTNVLGGFSMPETIFVDENNRILAHRRGPMTQEEMKERVQTSLRGDFSL